MNSDKQNDSQVGYAFMDMTLLWSLLLKNRNRTYGGDMTWLAYRDSLSTQQVRWPLRMYGVHDILLADV